MSKVVLRTMDEFLSVVLIHVQSRASSGFVLSDVKNSVNDLLMTLSNQFVVLMNALP